MSAPRADVTNSGAMCRAGCRVVLASISPPRPGGTPSWGCEASIKKRDCAYIIALAKESVARVLKNRGSRAEEEEAAATSRQE